MQRRTHLRLYYDKECLESWKRLRGIHKELGSIEDQLVDKYGTFWNRKTIQRHIREKINDAFYLGVEHEKLSRCVETVEEVPEK